LFDLRDLLKPLPTGPVCRVFTQSGRCDRAIKRHYRSTTSVSSSFLNMAGKLVGMFNC